MSSDFLTSCCRQIWKQVLRPRLASVCLTPAWWKLELFRWRDVQPRLRSSLFCCWAKKTGSLWVQSERTDKSIISIQSVHLYLSKFERAIFNHTQQPPNSNSQNIQLRNRNWKPFHWSRVFFSARNICGLPIGRDTSAQKPGCDSQSESRF